MTDTALRHGALVLADGEVFEGELIGAEITTATGEVVFNTSLSGYQEIITDPSYAGQMITFTYPHIGNYGVNAHDAESRGAFCRGVVVRELARRHSNHRAEGGLDAYLRGLGIPGIAGIDTRRLTRLLRSSAHWLGVQRCSAIGSPARFTTPSAWFRASARADSGCQLSARAGLQRMKSAAGFPLRLTRVS